MELSQIKPLTRTVEILHPATDDALGVRVFMRSLDDDRLKAAKRAINDEALRLQSRGKSFKAVDVENNTNRLLFGACEGWEWYNPSGDEGDVGYDPNAMPNFNGEQPEFNQKNFIDVLTALPWLRSQVNAAVDDEKAFFAHSGSN